MLGKGYYRFSIPDGTSSQFIIWEKVPFKIHPKGKFVWIGFTQQTLVIYGNLTTSGRKVNFMQCFCTKLICAVFLLTAALQTHSNSLNKIHFYVYKRKWQFNWWLNHSKHSRTVRNHSIKWNIALRKTKQRNTKP